jgi:hypothetical protein
MKRFFFIFGSLLLVASLTLAFLPPSNAAALPEYSAQTGEPCATCHVSPSGGGPRGPRGLAWVASSKPGTVPDLIESLETLGVELVVDPAYFSVVNPEVPEADALATSASQNLRLYRWLNGYDGN